MNLFLGRWSRESLPADDAEILQDRLIAGTISLILDMEGPLQPLPKQPTPEYYRTILRAVEHMGQYYPLDLHDQAPGDHEVLQHQALRSWAYHQACKDAVALLANWCDKADLAVPVSYPEHAVVLARALRAEHQQMLASGDNVVLLSTVVQECVMYLEGFVGLAPSGQAAAQAIREVNMHDWADSAWRVFIEWLVLRLPIGESAG